MTEGVAEYDNEELRVGVDEGVSDEVPVPDVVPDPEPVCVGVGGGDIVAVSVAVGEGDGVKDDVAVPLADPPAERVVDGVAETVMERLTVVEPLPLPEGV